MTSSPWVGLIAAGPVSPALARLPGLHAQLGPVTAASLRVASRIANGLKAGHHATPKKMDEASLILVSGPEPALPALLELAHSAGLDWSKRAIVLFDSHLDSNDLAAFAHLGAEVASLDPLDGFADLRFCGEGNPLALRKLKRFLTGCQAYLYVLEPGKKQVFSAGLAFTGTLATPLLAAAVDCFRKAGLDPKDAAVIAERTLLQTIRAWQKAGRQGWTGVLPQRDLEAVRRQLAALGEENSILGEYFSQTAYMALELFGHDAEWLRALDDETPPRATKAAGAGKP